MRKIIDSRRVLLQIFAICLLLSFVKSDSKPQKINETSKVNSTDSTDFKDFEVEIQAKINYLGVQIEGAGEYMIIYSKNDSFQNITQFIKTTSNKTIMWLNSEQIKQTFYLRVKCLTNEFHYLLQFLSKDKGAELEYGQFYSYYVTDETKNMNFLIKGTANLNSSKEGDLSLWAQGNQEITTSLKKDSLNFMFNSEKGTRYGLEAYQIPLDNGDQVGYILSVEGKLGDLINIGSLLFSSENICTTPIEEIKGQISGYLIDENGYNKEACFKFPEKQKPNINTLLEDQFSFKFEAKSPDNKENIYCIKMNNNDYEGLYSFINLNKNSNGYINVLPPLLAGTFYQLNIQKEQIIGLIPLIQDTNFNCLTFLFN